MTHEPCERCLYTCGSYVPAHYDRIQKVQYALCLTCQKETQTGLYKVRLSPVGSDYHDW